MTDIADCLKKSLAHLFEAFRRLWLWLFVATFIDQALWHLVGLLTRKDDTLYLSYTLFYLSIHLLLSTVTVVVGNEAFNNSVTGKDNPLFKTLKKYFKQMVIESTRAFGKVSLGILLFIIPGLIWSVRLFWVLYVVQFDEVYDKGATDALERSQVLTQGKLLWCIAILILSALFDLGAAQLMKKFELLESPLLYVISFGLTMLATLYSTGLLYFAFEKLMRQKALVIRGKYGDTV